MQARGLFPRFKISRFKVSMFGVLGSKFAVHVAIETIKATPARLLIDHLTAQFATWLITLRHELFIITLCPGGRHESNVGILVGTAVEASTAEAAHGYGKPECLELKGQV